MKYQIRFQSRSALRADSIAEAYRIVRRECGVARVRSLEAPNGIYCYPSVSAMRADETGARAMALITTEDGE